MMHPLRTIILVCYNNIRIRNRILSAFLHRDEGGSDYLVHLSFTGTLARRGDVRLLLPFSLHLLHCLQEGGGGSLGGGVWGFLRRMSGHIMSSLGGPFMGEHACVTYHLTVQYSLRHKECRNWWCHCSAFCVYAMCKYFACVLPSDPHVCCCAQEPGPVSMETGSRRRDGHTSKMGKKACAQLSESSERSNSFFRIFEARRKD